MKARRLILEADNSTENGAALSRGRPIREGRAEANTRREKEASAKMGSRTSEVRSTPVAPSQFTRKEKGKAVMTVEVPLRQDEVSLASIMMKTPLKRTAEVLAVSSDTKEDIAAPHDVIERAVEGTGGATCGPQ